jgi:hypothetical protein
LEVVGRERHVVIITAEPGQQPRFYLTGRAGALPILDPSTSLPPTVLAYADWLSALADRRPLPLGKPPPVVIAPAAPGEAFVALVSVEQKTTN